MSTQLRLSSIETQKIDDFCKECTIDQIQYFIDCVHLSNISTENLKVYINYIFAYLCRYDKNTETVFVYYKYNPDPTFNNCLAFRECCCRGDLEMAKWIYNLVSFDYNILDCWAFRKSCAKGKLEIAKWIHEMGTDVRIRNDEAFRFACFKNHLPVAEWLCELVDDYRIIIDSEFIHYKILSFYDRIRDLSASEMAKELDCKVGSILEQFIVECPICLKSKTEILFGCKHGICVECMLTWYIRDNHDTICPICRQNIDVENTIISENYKN